MESLPGRAHGSNAARAFHRTASGARDGRVMETGGLVRSRQFSHSSTRPRRTNRDTFVVAAMLIVAIVPSVATGKENRAADRVEAMAAFLAKAQRLSVTADCAYDVLQNTGEKIEFGERRVIVLRRPDRARIDITRRDGAPRRMSPSCPRLNKTEKVEQKGFEPST